MSLAVDCLDCPLRRQPLFGGMSAEEVAFMQRFKIDERRVAPGMRLLSEGEPSQELYTVLSGMGLRFKSLEDGARQVLSFVFPGDFLGLQAGVMGLMQHSAESRTEMTLCVFSRDALWMLFREFPERSFDLTWLAAIEEHFLGESLAAIGQTRGMVRLARAVLQIYLRGEALGLVRNGRMSMPFVQQDLADALGLSLVHTNKLLRRLGQEGAARWSGGALEILDKARLRRLAHMPGDQIVLLRPLM
jgi:CRP/FNR family transcriptional regulator